MVIVYPGAINSTHEISLSDGNKTWGLNIDSEESIVIEEPITQKKVNYSNADQRYGDFEPGISYFEQRSWIGGMGKNDFQKYQDGFAEGINLWSLADGKLMPAPQWEYSNGLRKSIEKTPGNMSWIPIRGDQSYISFPILIEGGDLELKDVNLWVKKTGIPGDLSVSFYSDLNGEPDQLVSGTELKISEGGLLCDKS